MELLLDLEPAQIPFRLVVVEGDAQVVEEGEHLLLPQQEPFEQVARGRLRQPASLPRSTLLI